MKLSVDRLKSKPVRSTFTASPEWWQEQMIEGRELDHCVEEPFRFEVDAYKLRDDVFLSGRLEGAIEVECSRCLRRYRHALAEPFRLVLEPAGAREPAEPEAAKHLARDGICLGEDLEIGWYRGPEISLDRFFSELISLALPMQPLCAEGCMGLCPRCGADRNQQACGCGELKPPSPFAVLASLRDGGNGGNP